MSKETEVALAGDWHGNTPWATFAIREVAGHNPDVREIFHLGDFGIWPGDGGKEYVRRVNEALVAARLRLFVTPGNHEDYTQIVDHEGTDVPTWLQPFASNIFLMPRGYRMLRWGKSVVSLGGAPSVDFYMRRGGVSWWPEEMIRMTDLERLAPADVMLAHDSPDGGTEAVQAICNTPPHMSMWRESGLRYAQAGRELMNIAVEKVDPRLFVHGHYHVADERFDTELNRRYVSLNLDGEPGNLALLDFEDLGVTWMEY